MASSGVPGRIDDGCGGAIFRAASDAVLLTDATGNILDVNPAFCAITGFARADVLGRNPRLLKSDRHDAEFYRRMWRAISEQGQWQGEIWDRWKSGEVHPAWLAIEAVRDAAGRVARYVGVFRDLTAGGRDEAARERMVHYDPLTTLPNRVLFRDRLDRAVEAARREGRGVALLFLDLDRFAPVNRSLGRPAGDELLRQVAARLSAVAGPGDSVARSARDEFLVLLAGAGPGSDVALVARNLLEAVRRPFEVDGKAVQLSASIGIAMSPADAEGLDELLDAADQAMQRARTAGGDRYQFVSRSLHARATAQVELETELEQAIERNELVLHYQPQVEPSRGRMVGVEALVRWNHPRQGLMAPARFVPLAEQTRLILPLGEWVIETACRQLRSWREEGLVALRVAVNLSAHQFEDPRLVERFAARLIEHGVDPRQVEVEITESSAMASPERTIERLGELRAIGIRISIDDFGTGYSSLSYLKRFPVDALKIDRSFLRDVPDDRDNATLCAAVIGLAHSLELRVVAEGVETRPQCDFLREHDCDELQGFLFSRPVPADRIADLLRGATSLPPPADARGGSSARIPTPGRGGRSTANTRRPRSAPPPTRTHGERRRDK